MTAITKTFTTIADAAVAPDAPVDTSLMTELRDNDLFLMQWVGNSYLGGAVQDHNHDGVNSAAVEVGPNHIRNGSFESSTNSWTLTDYTGGSHAIDSTHYIHGKQALAITSTVLANGGGQAVSSDYVAIAGSRYYQVSGYLWASAINIAAKIQIVWYNNTQAQISTTDVANVTNAPTTATEYGGAYQAPATARYARVLLIGGVPGAGTATGTVYFDGMGLSTVRSVGGRITQSLIENSAVGQAQLKAASGSVSTGNTSPTDLTLPGGAYGFWPQIRVNGSAGSATGAVGVSSTGFITNIALANNVGGANITYANQEYAQASPPYDEGDGPIPLYVFALMNADGTVAAAYCAPEAPYHYNGPTSVRADRYDTASGRAYRRVRQLFADYGSIAAARAAGLTVPAILDRLTTDALVEIEITQAMKMADRALIPHPFGKVGVGQTVVLLDPVSPMVTRLYALHAAERETSVLQLLHDGHISVSNTALPRSVGPGVMAVAPSWKLTV